MQLNLVTKDDFNYITDLESTFFRFPYCFFLFIAYFFLRVTKNWRSSLARRLVKDAVKVN